MLEKQATNTQKYVFKVTLVTQKFYHIVFQGIKTLKSSVTCKNK